VEAAGGGGKGEADEERRHDRGHAGRERAPTNEVGSQRRPDEELLGLQRLERADHERQDVAGDHPEDDGSGYEGGDAHGEPEGTESGYNQTGHEHRPKDVLVRHRLHERGDEGDDGRVPGHEQRLSID
jgi:hypothetical protein